MTFEAVNPLERKHEKEGEYWLHPTSIIKATGSPKAKILKPRFIGF